MEIKICGLRDPDNVSTIAALQPDWMGFIFASTSPRYFLRHPQHADLHSLPKSIKKVGVFVDDHAHKVAATQQFYGLDAVQLHGDETPEDCEILQVQGIVVIKAFSVNERFDFDRVKEYEPYVDFLLFDTAGASRGGNGIQFNWALLNKQRFNRPFLLSGGIGPHDVNMLKAFEHPNMVGVDVNSRFETAHGVKNIQQLQSFMEQLK